MARLSGGAGGARSSSCGIHLGGTALLRRHRGFGGSAGGAAGRRRMVPGAAAPVMAVAASPPPGMTGQVVAPCGGAVGGGTRDPAPGDVAGGAWRPELSLASTALDAGESQPSEVCGSEGLWRLERRPWTLDGGNYRGHVDDAMAGSSFW